MHASSSAQELVQKASSSLGDLREKVQMLSKKDQQATTALSSAANKVRPAERERAMESESE